MTVSTPLLSPPCENVEGVSLRVEPAAVGREVAPRILLAMALTFMLLTILNDSVAPGLAGDDSVVDVVFGIPGKPLMSFGLLAVGNEMVREGLDPRTVPFLSLVP